MMVSPEQRSPPAIPPPEDIPLGEPQSISQALAQATAAPVESSTPVEMSTLDQRHPIAPEPDISNLPQSSTSTPPTSTTTEKPLPSSHPDPVSQLGPSSSAIQSTQNQTPTIVPEPTSDPTKILLITLLLLNGARHPYKIDERYLSRRNVNVDGNNPINMTIYTLKELIWRDWREEWEPRPTSPGMIRLIHAGHMPEDKMRLGDGRFALGTTPHVVHMSVKLSDLGEDEEAGKSPSANRDGDEASPRCRCCVVM